MVRDGYFYGIGGILAAGAIAWLSAWPYAIPVLLLTAFCLWFFRDPERAIPAQPGAIVSAGDGKVTDVSIVIVDGVRRQRVSTFLNVFDVHVNRSPISGVIHDVCYQRGKFLNAMGAHSAEENEPNIVTVEGQGRTVVFKQIAGLIARRIVFDRKIGDNVARGERIGLIKFGSRVDVLFDEDAVVQVKPGDRVKGGASVLAMLPVAKPNAQNLEQEAPAAWKS